MTSPDLTSYTVKRLSGLISAREVAPVEIATAFLEKIDRVNPHCRAYITTAGDEALKAARAAEARIGSGGPLNGIPYACKDLFLTKGIRTTGGSRVLEDNIPDRDAEAVSRLAVDGGVLLGKLNQHEFAYGATGKNEHFGTTPNPWDKTRLAGGSSSGSAYATAAGLAPFALGTDTGGSTRAPAALCGVVGLKPTYGLVSLEGTIPYCWSLDHMGIFSKTVDDAAIVLKSLTGDISLEPARLENLKGTRIGVPKNFFFDVIDPEILEAVQQVLKICRDEQAVLIDVDLPSMDMTRTESLTIQLPEVLSYHSRYMPHKKHLYGQDILAGMALGQFILAEHYVKAKRMIQWRRNEMEKVFQKADLIITPSCPITAPLKELNFIEWPDRNEPVGNAITRYTSFFNMTGNPAISIPMGLHSTGLPMGVQIIGKNFDESGVLTAARFLEKRLNATNPEQLDI